MALVELDAEHRKLLLHVLVEVRADLGFSKPVGLYGLLPSPCLLYTSDAADE